MHSYCHRVAELDDPDRCFPLTAEDFARVNPNTGTAPIFRTRRDAALTTAIYNRLPVLVDRSSGEAVKAWPVKYTRMFDMTNDSGLFRTRAELEEREGAYGPSAVIGSAAHPEIGCRSMSVSMIHQLRPPRRESVAGESRRTCSGQRGTQRQH